MDCHEFEELASAYVLGAVTPEEHEAAARHLAGCSNCQHLLRELQSVTDLLPLAVPEVEPPPHMKTRVLAAIRADSPPLPAQQRSVRQEPRRSWWNFWETRLVLTCALLFAFLFGGVTLWNISLQQQLTQIAAASSPTMITTIHGTTAAADASGEVLYFPRLHMTTLVMHNLPPLAGSQVYQGWVIANGHPKSIGLLNINIRDGTAALNVSGDVNSYQVVAISKEPGPQASQEAPKGQIVATGSVNRQ